LSQLDLVPLSTASCEIIQSLLIDGYEWAFKACTREGSGPQLSQKEIRCVQAGMTNFIDAR
jgi:hypothetical protein